MRSDSRFSFGTIFFCGILLRSRPDRVKSRLCDLNSFHVLTAVRTGIPGNVLTTVRTGYPEISLRLFAQGYPEKMSFTNAYVVIN